MKNFAHKLNEQPVPVQDPEEKVWIAQAENAPLVIELDNDSILKHVGPLKGFNHIDVYVDEDDVKYVVGEQDDLEELAAQSWAKRVESGTFSCDAMPWEFIIKQGSTLGMLDSKTVEMVANALVDSTLDAKGVKQVAEAIWGADLKSIAKQIITFDGIEMTGFLSFDDPKIHDVNDSDMFAMCYEFEV